MTKSWLILFIYFVTKKKCRWTRWRKCQLTKNWVILHLLKTTVLSLRVCQPDEKYLFFNFLRLILEFYEYVKLTKSLLFFVYLFDESLRECQLTKSLLSWRLFMLTKKIWSLRICQLDKKLTYFTFIYFMRKKCSWRKGQLTKTLYSLRLFILQTFFDSLPYVN